MINQNRIRMVVIFIAVAVLCSCLSSATESFGGLTDLYSGWVSNGDSVNAQNKLFVVSTGSSGEVAYFNSGDLSEFVRTDSCKLKETYYLCVDAIDSEGGKRRSSVRIYRSTAS